MGLLDSILGAAAGQLGGQAAGANPILKLALQLIQNQQGGVQGLINQFTQAGLGQQAQSWVGTGANMSLSPDDLLRTLGGGGGGGGLQQMASQLGLNQNEAAGGLAQLLPELINQLTPNGKIENDVLEQGLSAIRGKFLNS